MELERCCGKMAQLHKRLLAVPYTEGLGVKEQLRRNIEAAKPLPLSQKLQALQRLNALPDGQQFCHGDFHPGNILLRGEEAVPIDFMIIARGDPLFDIARTVYLVQYTPIPDWAEDETAFRELKTNAASLYLQELGVSRGQIEPFLYAITAARLAELWPHQETERQNCLRYLETHI